MPRRYLPNGHYVSYDGPIRLDLTPIDLLQHGYAIREARTDGKFCWWHRCEYGSEGQSFGPEFDKVEDAVANARHHLTADRYQSRAQLHLLVI